MTHYTLDFVVAHCDEQFRQAVEAIVHYGVPHRRVDSKHDFRVVMYHKCGTQPETRAWDEEYHVQHVRLTNVGYEAHTYIEHLVRNYDHLATTTLFLQGDFLSHSAFVATCDLPRHIRSHPFVSFGTDLDRIDGPRYREAGCGQAGRVEAMFQSFWPEFALPPSGSPQACFRATSHGLFAVHISRVRAHPRSFYAAALNLTLSPHVPLAEMPWARPRSCGESPALPLKEAATLWEAGWHIVFGEDACLRSEAAMPFEGQGDEESALRAEELLKQGNGPRCAYPPPPSPKPPPL